MKESLVIFQVGISGCGKSTLCKAVTTGLPYIKRLIGITTRPRRASELDGQDREFISKSEFETLREADELCLVNNVYDNYYAYRVQDFFSGGIYIGEIYYKYLLDAKEYHKNTVGILVRPTNISCAVDGIVERDNCPDESLQRIKHLSQEQYGIDAMLKDGIFDYQFTNRFDQTSKNEFVLLIQQIVQKKMAWSQAPL